MNRRKWMRIGLLLIAAALYIGAAFFCHWAKEAADLTYLVLSRSIDSMEAEEIFAQEKTLANPIGFCFWGEAGTQMLFCKETGGITQVTQVLLSGNPGIVDSGVLAWQEGCFVDENTAQKLFGTADCGGQTLWQGDVQYRVLGTISAFQPTMLTVAAQKDGAVLNRCVLSVPAESGDALGQQFLMRWGLQGNLIGFYPIWTFVHNLLLFFPCVFLLSALIYGRKEWKKTSFSDFRSLAKPVLLPILATGLLCFLGSRMIVLQDMIPSRWSDFSFWGAWLEAQKENFHHVLLTPMGGRLLQMMLDMVKSMVCTTAAFLISLWIIK